MIRRFTVHRFTAKGFTGWHMTAIMVAFFGVVIAVNFVMASDAVRTFGGEVVENSYVASQRYNGWLAEARAQEREGWRADPAVRPDRRLALNVGRGTQAVDGARVTVIAQHPLGTLPDRTLQFATGATAGQYLSDAPLPAGRWLLRITIEQNGKRAHFDDEVHI